MKVLALDQSVKATGWAIVSRRTLGLPPIVEASGFFGTKGALTTRDKVDAFVDQVRQLLLDYEPEHVIWEKPNAFMGAHGVTARTLILTRLDEAMTRVCEQLDVSCEAVAANTWRAKILGKGAGKLPRAEAKQRALNYCRWMDMRVNSDDEAEAICIGFWALTFSKQVLAQVA